MKEELKAIGLTDGEIEVYLALLKLGSSTNSPIARISHLQSSTVYYCLNSLIEKGFVSYISRGNRKYFQATNPENILNILEEKEKELSKTKSKIRNIIPELKKYQEIIKEKTTAEVYEGFNGFKVIFNQILNELKRGDSYEAFAVEQTIGESKAIRLLFIQHNKALKSKGIKLRLLAHERMRPIFQKMYKKGFLKKYQGIRYTKETTPVGITIYKEKVVTHILEDNIPFSFKIKNQKLAEAYRNYFNSIWKKAKQ